MKGAYRFPQKNPPFKKNCDVLILEKGGLPLKPRKKMGGRAVGFAVALAFLVIGGCLLGYFLWPRKDEPGIAFATLLATQRPVSAEAMLEAARSADAAAVAAAKKAADAKAAALAAQLNSELRAALAAEASKLTAAAEAAAALAAKLNGELRAAEAAEAAKRVAEAQAAQAAEAAEAAKRVAEAAEAAEAAKRVVEAQAAEDAKAGTSERRKGTVPIEAALPVPVVSETTLPSWPFDVGAPGASCAATCDGKGLVCDEERQASATYGRAIAFEALRRGGVAQKEASEDEWQGRFRVRDKYTFEQVGAMPGLLMAGSAGSAGSEGVPNWKGEDNKSAPSTCAASLEGLRRVCACKAPATNPPATNPPATPVPEREAWALSAGERAAGLETRLVYERGIGLSPGVPETPVDFPDPGMRRYLFPENQKQHLDFGTYVLVIELVEGALERLGEGNIVLFKLSEFKNTGDPEIHISRARGLRVYEGGGNKEVNAPAYYAGTKLALINDRKRRDSEMLVRAGDKTITVKMSGSWPGCNTPMELQVHDLVKRAVFLWGLDTVTLDVSALKAEV